MPALPIEAQGPLLSRRVQVQSVRVRSDEAQVTKGESSMSQYTGKCIVRISTGEILSVHVVDSTGMGMTLSPEEYVARGVKPPLDQLPNCSSARS